MLAIPKSFLFLWRNFICFLLEIWSVCMKAGRGSIVDLVFDQSLVNDSSANTTSAIKIM